MDWERLAAQLPGLLVLLTTHHLIFASGIVKDTVRIPALPTALPVTGGWTTAAVTHAMLANVWTERDTVCITVPSLNVCRLLSVGHKNLIIQGTNIRLRVFFHSCTPSWTILHKCKNNNKREKEKFQRCRGRKEKSKLVFFDVRFGKDGGNKVRNLI